jgi:hypothetical protein
VLFKFEADGSADMLSLDDLQCAEDAKYGGHLFEGMRPGEWDDWRSRLFLDLCILSGCDYLQSLPGIGVRTAHSLLRQRLSVDQLILERLGQTAIAADYLRSFERARQVFKHQLVWDGHGLRPLTPLPVGFDLEGAPHLGLMVSPALARSICVDATIDARSLQPIGAHAADGGERLVGSAAVGRHGRCPLAVALKFQTDDQPHGGGSGGPARGRLKRTTDAVDAREGPDANEHERKRPHCAAQPSRPPPPRPPAVEGGGGGGAPTHSRFFTLQAAAEPAAEGNGLQGARSDAARAEGSELRPAPSRVTAKGSGVAAAAAGAAAGLSEGSRGDAHERSALLTRQDDEDLEQLLAHSRNWAGKPEPRGAKQPPPDEIAPFAWEGKESSRIGFAPKSSPQRINRSVLAHIDRLCPPSVSPKRKPAAASARAPRGSS